VFFSTASYSQYVKIKHNNMYLSAGTSIDFQSIAPLYSVASVAYVRNLFYPCKGVWNARAGVGGVTLLMKPLGYYYYADMEYRHGQHWHHLEVAAGVSGLYNTETKAFEWWTSELEYPLPISIYVGYRFHLPNGGYIYRVGVGWPEQLSMSVGFSF